MRRTESAILDELLQSQLGGLGILLGDFAQGDLAALAVRTDQLDGRGPVLASADARHNSVVLRAPYLTL